MGTPVDLADSWQIKVISVVPDATNIVLRENQFNNPPAAGNQFFLARVSAKYMGTGSGTFNGGLRLKAVGSSSVSYSTYENSPGVIPDPIPMSEVFSGGSIEGNIGWEVKSSDANALVMYDNPFFSSRDDRTYMALYSESNSDLLSRKIARTDNLIQELNSAVHEGDNFSAQASTMRPLKPLTEPSNYVLDLHQKKISLTARTRGMPKALPSPNRPGLMKPSSALTRPSG